MAAAIGWGALAASALLVGALIAYHLSPTPGVIASIMGLGAGLLIGSVSFELVEEALKTRSVAGGCLIVLCGAEAGGGRAVRPGRRGGVPRRRLADPPRGRRGPQGRRGQAGPGIGAGDRA